MSRCEEVNCTGWEPSRFATQISLIPERLEAKAIRLPSSENSAFQSSRVEEMSLRGPPDPADTSDI